MKMSIGSTTKIVLSFLLFLFALVALMVLDSNKAILTPAQSAMSGNNDFSREDKAEADVRGDGENANLMDFDLNNVRGAKSLQNIDTQPADPNSFFVLAVILSVISGVVLMYRHRQENPKVGVQQ